MAKRYSLGDIVEVEVLDLASHDGSEEVDETGPFHALVWGEVIRIEKEYISIGFCRGRDSINGETNFDMRISLPKGCIQRVSVLKRLKK